MKKILAMFLAILMLSAVCVIPVSAAEDELEQKFYDYCLEELGEDSLYEGAQVNITDTKRAGDITFFTASSWVESNDVEVYEVVGNYCVHNSAMFSPYYLGVYVYAEGQVYDLETAWEQGLVESISLVNGLSVASAHWVGEYGDVADLTHKCADAYSEYAGLRDGIDELFCFAYGTVDECIIFHADVNGSPDAESYQQIGEYIFYCGCIAGPEDTNPVGLYVLDGNGDIWSLKDAYTKDIITDMDAVAAMVPGTVSAFEPFEKRIRDILELNRWEDGYFYDEKYYYYAEGNTPDESTPDYVLVWASAGAVTDSVELYEIGPYTVVAYAGCHPYPLGYYIYVPSADKLYTLAEAYEAQIEGIDKVFTDGVITAGIVGDTDGDFKITVRDATFIQKLIAGLVDKVFVNETLDPAVRDFNNDREINIKDATAIQKHVAGIA